MLSNTDPTSRYNVKHLVPPGTALLHTYANNENIIFVLENHISQADWKYFGVSILSNQFQIPSGSDSFIAKPLKFLEIENAIKGLTRLHSRPLYGALLNEFLAVLNNPQLGHLRNPTTKQILDNFFKDIQSWEGKNIVANIEDVILKKSKCTLV